MLFLKNTIAQAAKEVTKKIAPDSTMLQVMQRKAFQEMHTRFAVQCICSRFFHDKSCLSQVPLFRKAGTQALSP